MTDEEIDAFLDAEDATSDEEIDAFLDAPDQPEGDPGLARATAAAQTTSFGFADELQAGLETVNYAAGELFSPRPVEISDLVDYYRERRDAYRGEAAQLAESNPTETAQGTAIGVAAGLAGANPLSLARGAAAGGRALLTAPRAALASGARSLLSREGAKAVGAGAALGGAAAAGASEADLTEGEVGEFAGDVAEGAGIGAAVGAGARGLLSAGSANTAARTQRAAEGVAAAQAAERDQALLKTGLETRQKKLGGPARAKERALALVDEPMPGDPTKKLVDEAEKLSAEDRYTLANGLRREQGEVLGGIRKELSESKGIEVSAAPIRAKIREAFSDLPAEVQAKALEQVDAMIGAASKDGALAPGALRKLIEDAEGLARFGSPSTDSILGAARRRVFQAARAVFVQNERELVEKVLPQRANEYGEALRKYSVYSDFEEGAKIKFERANKGQAQVREPKRTEDQSTGRKLLRAAAGELGARVGGLVPVPGAAIAGARAGEAVVERWGRWLDPTVASRSAKLKKLERLQPMMEQALAEGPAAVARLHSQLMARSPDYRKAIESEE